jgi:hypothetical protein
LSGLSLDLIAPLRPLQLCADGGYQLRLGVLGVPLIMVPDTAAIHAARASTSVATHRLPSHALPTARPRLPHTLPHRVDADGRLPQSLHPLMQLHLAASPTTRTPMEGRPNPRTRSCSFTSQEKNYSMVLLAVVDLDTKFTDIVTGWPGSMKESSILHNSGLLKLYEKGERLSGSKLKVSDGSEIEEYLIGDSGYPFSPGCSHLTKRRTSQSPLLSSTLGTLLREQSL